MAQIRLDPDVHEALRAIANRDGVSLAHVANARLRSLLGLSTRLSDTPAGPAKLTAPVRLPARRRA